MVNFQAISKVSGQAYQDVVRLDLETRGISKIQENVALKDLGIEIDFIANNKQYIECKGGYNGKSKRPGAKRTDNVKKSIANGALLKSVNPSAKYIVYFSAKPKVNSASAKMLKNALKSKVIDEIRYVGYNGLEAHA